VQQTEQQHCEDRTTDETRLSGAGNLHSYSWSRSNPRGASAVARCCPEHIPHRNSII
jgi:uncharacterized OB-fold protein